MNYPDLLTHIGTRIANRNNAKKRRSELLTDLISRYLQNNGYPPETTDIIGPPEQKTLVIKFQQHGFDVEIPTEIRSGDQSKVVININGVDVNTSSEIQHAYADFQRQLSVAIQAKCDEKADQI